MRVYGWLLAGLVIACGSKPGSDLNENLGGAPAAGGTPSMGGSPSSGGSPSGGSTSSTGGSSSTGATSNGGSTSSTGGSMATGGDEAGGDATGGDESGGEPSGGDAGEPGTTGGGGGMSTGGRPQGGRGGGNGGSSGGGPSRDLCPSSPPENGSECEPPDPSTGVNSFPSAQCSWGDDPRPQCRVSALCQQDGTWSVQDTLPDECEAPAACLMSPPENGTTCSSDSPNDCWYEDGTHCWCSSCQGGSGYPNCSFIDPPEWYCSEPTEECPTPPPQAGTPCDFPDDVSCGPSCELPIFCVDGFWQWNGNGCPICASPDTPIATPDGERPIASLKAGDLVYSVDHDALVPVPIARVAHTLVTHHQVVRLTLESGRVIEMSAGHPTWDGRRFGDLQSSNLLDPTSPIDRVEVVPYQHDATYDILPSSSTGTYVAAGALVGSTLR